MIQVITGFSPKGLIEYGHRFMDTFERHWSKDIALSVYVEEPIKSKRARVVMLSEVDGVNLFIDRHRNDPDANGRGDKGRWKERHRRFDYNFRFDAVKFCRQCFIPAHAADDLEDGDLLVWLDGDVVTLDTPPKDFLPTLIGNSDIAFLGRKGVHSEIGYWSVRINARTRRFIQRFAEVWDNDEVFTLPEWHSAFVFDHVRRECNLREVNLTPDGRGHVWLQSPLAKYTDHCKGNRKALGHSPERNRQHA